MRPNVLTIAGFDPSGGAGILADIKTFEQLNCLGMAVQTANTVQTENRFQSVNWVDKNLIKKQLNFLLEQYQFEFVKVGIIQDLELLEDIMAHPALSDAKFIWDPVLSSSAGFDFQLNLYNLSTVLSRVFMITPNVDEMKVLETILPKGEISSHTNLLLKGGHSDRLGVDVLVDLQGDVHEFHPNEVEVGSIHGSGCILSSAIVACLACGNDLKTAIEKAKRYTEDRLKNNQGLLAYHS